jgi:hypothetical protein
MTDHARFKLRYGSSDDRLARLTRAMISFGAIRKLLMTIPSSQEYEVSEMRDFLRQDLQLPRSAATALDNLGKFEIDDFVCRIKYHSLDVT